MSACVTIVARSSRYLRSSKNLGNSLGCAVSNVGAVCSLCIGIGTGSAILCGELSEIGIEGVDLGSLDIGEGGVDVGKSNIVYGGDCVGERLRCRWSPNGTCSKLKSGEELEWLLKLASTSSRKVLGEESELRMVL